MTSYRLGILVLFALPLPPDVLSQTLASTKFDTQSSTDRSKGKPDDCLGPEKASRHILFLHGMMPTQSGLNTYQVMLSRVASDSHIRIYAPVSRNTCSGSQQCWQRDPGTAAMKQFVELTKDASRCFGPNVSTFEAHGHSNGAYYLGSLADLCELKTLSRILFLGGGSLSTFRIKPRPSCPELHFASGDKDRIHSPLTELAGKVRAMGFKTFFHSLKGGHDLGEEVYREILGKTGEAPNQPAIP